MLYKIETYTYGKRGSRATFSTELNRKNIHAVLCENYNKYKHNSASEYGYEVDVRKWEIIQATNEMI